jgi:ribosomal protein S18 acetylase RimI-like enzyme
VEIRRATFEDAGGIASVHVRAWQVAYREIIPEEFLRSLSIERRTEIWRENLRNPDAETRVAEEAGRVVGWASTGASRDPDAEPETGELWAIYVDPDAWGTGVGRALWQEAEAALRRAGFRSVTLWVLEENGRARRFYEALGFRVDPGHEQMLERGGTSLREIRLRREL